MRGWCGYNTISPSSHPCGRSVSVRDGCRDVEHEHKRREALFLTAMHKITRPNCQAVSKNNHLRCQRFFHSLGCPEGLQRAGPGGGWARIFFSRLAALHSVPEHSSHVGLVPRTMNCNKSVQDRAEDNSQQTELDRAIIFDKRARGPGKVLAVTESPRKSNLSGGEAASFQRQLFLAQQQFRLITSRETRTNRDMSCRNWTPPRSFCHGVS